MKTTAPTTESSNGTRFGSLEVILAERSWCIRNLYFVDANSGNSVIQRQAWLMEQRNLSKDDAYDQARQEFYDQRMREDIERRVAKEEATATGAYFAKTRIGIGAELENKSFEVFRAWAEKTAMELDQARAAVYSGLDTTETSSTDSSLGDISQDPSLLDEPGAIANAPIGTKGQPAGAIT